LKAGKVPAERIVIFVADEAEQILYHETIPSDLYGFCIIGVPGLREQRNFISDFYMTGQRIVSMDDDVKGFYKVVPPVGLKRSLTGSKLVLIDDVDQFFQQGFKECEMRGFHLWGVAPVANAGFMKDEVDTTLKFCPGWTFGYINRRFKISVALKQDYEITLQNFVADGGVIRFSGVCGKTRMFAVGGLNARRTDRIERNRAAANQLMEKYPGLVLLKKMKDITLSGTEIRLVCKEV
jgi:hypothetical protein